MFIIDSQLLSYLRCPRKAFLDISGDFRQQESPSDFLLKLIKDSSAFGQVFLVITIIKFRIILMEV